MTSDHYIQLECCNIMPHKLSYNADTISCDIHNSNDR